jgi:hypothetical protein
MATNENEASIMATNHRSSICMQQVANVGQGKQATKATLAVQLVVAWAMVIGYIILGGAALRAIELEKEVKQATDYCVKVKYIC